MSTSASTTRTTWWLIATLLIANLPEAYAVDLRRDVDPLVEQLLAEDLAVGLVVGVFKDGQTQVLGYGETEKRQGVAPDGDTIYEIGSASKVFTGVLLADLVQRGRVKLDDPMQKYLSEPAKSQLKNSSRITFEHLATHASGLPSIPENAQPADVMNPYADYTYKQLFAFLKDHQLRRAPGEYEYSNLGMGLLGVLIAGREKASYEQLMVERITIPCGMVDTRVTLSNEQRQRLAPPYDAALQATKNWDFPTLAGAGGIRSTTNDMLKFIAANLANDDKPLTKALQFSHQKRHALPDGQAIGLAWHIEADGVTRWHNGMTGGYSSWVAVAPGRNVGVVVLANTAAEQITELGQKITRIAMGEKLEPSEGSSVAKVPQGVLQSYEGVYTITPEFALTVTLDGNTLMVQATGQQKLRLSPESETKFACKAVDAYIFFVANDSGKVKSLVLHQNGANQIGTRRAATPRPIVQVGRAVLEKYEGVYAITPDFALTVSLEGDKLMVQATGQQKLELSPESETKFSCKVVDARLTFVPGEQGHAGLLILHQNGANQVATRQN